MPNSYAKKLTKNDAGETGGHQAGIVVPKADLELINFFPFLNPEEFNPDAWLNCIDPEGMVWEMRYIYYNGKSFKPPKNTRNEYRITHMTRFFSKWGAESGDGVIFTKTNKENSFQIRIIKPSDIKEDKSTYGSNKPIVLRGWSRVF
jgi:hypothetical protein